MAKILQSAPVYHVDRFSYKNGVFSAFLSDFGGRQCSGRLYDDACDEGFGITSKVTGNVVYFSHVHDEVADGTLMYSQYIAIVQPGSALEGLRVLVFNT